MAPAVHGCVAGRRAAAALVVRLGGLGSWRAAFPRAPPRIEGGAATAGQPPQPSAIERAALRWRTAGGWRALILQSPPCPCGPVQGSGRGAHF
jgi:hypothetical protein